MSQALHCIRSVMLVSALLLGLVQDIKGRIISQDVMWKCPGAGVGAALLCPQEVHDETLGSEWPKLAALRPSSLEGESA